MVVLANLLVGRVEENKVEAGIFVSQPPKSREDGAGQEAKTGFDSERRQVLADQLHGGPVVLDKDYFARTAAERLEADRAGAGEAVEADAGAEAVGEDVENRAFDLVLHRPDRGAGDQLEAAALVDAADDPDHVSR